jgi:uncharacterized membrane protein (UPF0136 family)
MNDCTFFSGSPVPVGAHGKLARKARGSACFADMNSSVQMVLWVYAALLLVGGVMGLVKAGSKVSLIVSTSAAILIAVVAFGHLPLLVARVEIGALIGVFIFRYLSTRKPMPAFPLIGLSAVVLALTFVLASA